MGGDWLDSLKLKMLDEPSSAPHDHAGTLEILLTCRPFHVRLATNENVLWHLVLPQSWHLWNILGTEICTLGPVGWLTDLY